MADEFNSRNILDFYYLEAMVNRAKRLPEAPLPSQEKWKSDLERQYEPFVKGFAASVRDYLFLACMGEARHGYAYGGTHFPELGNDMSRIEAYRRSIRYSPEKNISKLIALFGEYDWYECGYGGPPWGAIATALKLYGQVPDVVFIDLVVSIEHNGGNVFNKTEVSRVIAFKCDLWVYDILKGFLDHKASQDILSHPEARYLKWLSRETLSFLDRYFHVISRKDAPRDVRAALAKRRPRLPQKYESSFWGNQILGQLELSEREDESEEEIQTEENYDEYSLSVSATPKMPRG